MPTSFIEDTLRELALPRGLVDPKVCAVTEVGPGCKLVVRNDGRQEVHAHPIGRRPHVVDRV